MPDTVLIVDDNKIVRTFVKIQLVARKFAYLEAENGDDALELVKTRGINLVIADLNMPGRGGLSLLSEIRNLPNPELSGLPFIVLTSDLDAEAENIAIAAGATAFLHKPVNAAGLLDAVTRALPTSVF